MSTNARTPDGFKKVADGVQVVATIAAADSPYDLASDTYLIANSTAGPITVNLPSAKNGDILTVSHPAGVTNDVTLVPQADELPAAPIVISANGETSFRAIRTVDGSGDPIFGWFPL